MASILDIGFLEHFRIIFPFLLVLVLVYAGLTMTMMKDKKGIAAFVALGLAIMTLFSNLIIEIINLMTPILVIFFIIIIFIFIGFGIYGVNPTNILHAEYGKHIGWWTFIVFLLIIIGSINSVLSEQGGVPGPGATGHYIGNGTQLAGTGAEGTQQGVFFTTIFNAKVLGMIVVLIISMITIQRLTIQE